MLRKALRNRMHFAYSFLWRSTLSLALAIDVSKFVRKFVRVAPAHCSLAIDVLIVSDLVHVCVCARARATHNTCFIRQQLSVCVCVCVCVRAHTRMSVYVYIRTEHTHTHTPHAEHSLAFVMRSKLDDGGVSICTFVLVKQVN